MGSAVRGWGRSDAARVKIGERKVCKGERGGDNISAMKVIVGDSRIKDEGAIPVRVPREVVIGTGEGKTELAGG